MRCLTLYLALFAALWLGNSCATPAPPSELPEPPEPGKAVEAAEPPRYALEFEGATAESPSRVFLRYSLRVENAAARDAGTEIGGWKVLLNGAEGAFPAGLLAGEREGGAVQLGLDLDLPEDGGDFDEYRVTLALILAETGIPLEAEAVFPRIREPQFVISSIAILKDELVNTRFRVDLRIENPNIFPVVLSSFGYELYGRDRFWAGGEERDLLEVPAKGFAEARLQLVMNFINMRRDLLDEVIALGNVPYRFTGEVRVDTPVPLLPSFRMGFDRRGTSTVLK
ncbi:MAG: LEA type 2 family protein [Treponema sp.]|jgi:LEA14-like dessication related protein|nr:LEA type 2 family protein [Treponema sp.]